MIKNLLLRGSGPSLNPGVYKDTLPEHKSRRSRVIVRNKELESEVVIVVLIFHPVKVNVNTVVSRVSAHGCLNIHRDFGPHGCLPRT